jgi:membrane protease YdiL (CAAX protease family)
LPEQTSGETSPRRIGEVIAVTLLTWAIFLLLLKFGSTFSLLKAYVPLVAIAPLIYVPLIVILYRRDPLADYGLTLAHIGRAFGMTVLVMVIVFPPYALGFHIYRQGLIPLRFSGLVGSAFAWFNWLLHTPRAGPWLLQSFFWQYFFVALPEEFFYRGYLQARFNALFGGRYRVFGTAVGVALPISATIFALHHFLISPAPQALLVFFPALLFSWLRETTGSLLAPGLFHAACNVFAVLLTKAARF